MTVKVDGIVKRFDGRPPTVAIDHLQLTIDDGEFIVLLGPSGCGKTTTLRCIAGLESPDEGRIELQGKVVYDSATRINLPPDRRSIGMVFQSYALWPHLSVRRNIAYPLRARKLSRGIAEDWVGDMARLVDCESLLDRLPSELSGGQQQRIALARGLVARPELVLLDEPMSNLDAKLRDQVRAQMHELHADLGFTAVFVTHDQAEAFALADRAVIMNSGRIEQVDDPRRIWAAPASDYVASFIGMANRLELERHPEGWRIPGTSMQIPFADLAVDRSLSSVALRIRAGDLRVVPPDVPTEEGTVHVVGTLIDSIFGGDVLDVAVDVGGFRLHAQCELEGTHCWVDQVPRGSEIAVRFALARARCFDRETGAAMGISELSVV
ncbi:ABC transporter related [Parafrankia sp. EAN1pec]|uniref:ABC transporter ATP-binding protein n=1 Tax=Parafrankia sp. (strain EAN1pec) TaxID=298653 RepID=UPI00005436C6|nr:ABC transporter related [Frankia sp. EAN1pec]